MRLFMSRAGALVVRDVFVFAFFFFFPVFFPFFGFTPGGSALACKPCCVFGGAFGFDSRGFFCGGSAGGFFGRDFRDSCLGRSVRHF
jgi:hypothetical protein